MRKAHSQIVASIDLLSRNDLKALKISEFYRTPAFPKGAGPDFINCAVLCETMRSANQILETLHNIEKQLGRVRSLRWGQRSIDLDLIAHHGEIAPDLETLQGWIDLPLDQQMQRTPEHLLLPHPRLQDRAFVLRPMADIAPHWRHPVLGFSTLEMLANLPQMDRDEISLYDASS